MTATTFLLILIGLIALVAVFSFKRYLREKQLRAALDRELESRLSMAEATEAPTDQAPRPAPVAHAELTRLPPRLAEEEAEAALGKEIPFVQPISRSEAAEAKVAPTQPTTVEETVIKPTVETPLPVQQPPLAMDQPTGKLQKGDAVATGERPAPAVSAQRPEARLLEAEPLVRRASEHRGSLLISPTLPPGLERVRIERELRRIAERRAKNRRIALIAGLAIILLVPAYYFIPPVHRLFNPYVRLIGIRLGLIPPPPPPEWTLAPKELEVSYTNQLEEVDGKITLSGTVRNIAEKRTFDGLYAELSLVKKENKLIETRVVAVQPKRLAPGDEGRYEITLSASEFIGNRRVRILSNGTEIPYRYVLPVGKLEIQGGGGQIKTELPRR